MVDTWIINGLSPRWISSVDLTAFPKVTIHCASYPDNKYPEPIDEINAFKSMACNSITNEPTQSGGTDIETSMDGSIIPISDGISTWLGALHIPTWNEDEMVHILIEYDLVLELSLVNKDIVPDTPNPPDITKPYNLITNGYAKKINTIGTETDLLGSFTFYWDGTGRVYVASDWQANPETDLISIDDELIVTNKDGISFTRSCNAGNHYAPGPDIELTSFLEEGDNQISFKIKDLYGSKIGCGPLFLIQV